MPRPEAFYESMLSHKKMPLWERLSQEKKLKNLITAEGSLVDIPGYLEIYGELACRISQAWCIEGNALPDFIKLVEEKKLLPQSQDDHKAFAFWRDQFGIYIVNKRDEQKVTVSRATSSCPTLTWRYEGYNEYKAFLPKEARMGIIGLAVLPDNLWRKAAAGGLIIGNFVDVSPDSWDVDIQGAVLSNENRVLDFNNTDGFISFNGSTFALCMLGSSTLEVIKTHIVKTDPIGIFADMRTMK
jgi:hypothetical protein